MKISIEMSHELIEKFKTTSIEILNIVIKYIQKSTSLVYMQWLTLQEEEEEEEEKDLLH